MIQAIGYVRRSTDRQEESLDQQRAKLEAFAASKGWQLVHVYVDDAISGSDMDRPGLQEMMQRAETDKGVQAVIAWDRNRLARAKDPIDALMLERRLTGSGKRLVYAATSQEAGRSFTDGLIGFVEHYQAGDYLRKLSRDVARGVLARVRRGRWPGGPIPFGFDRLFVDHDGTPRKIVRQRDDGSLLVLDASTGETIEEVASGNTYKKQSHEEVTLTPSEPARVRAVQKMFADYAAGVPTRKIRDDLNAAGFRTTFCRSFAIPSINVILENQAYTGRCVYNQRTESKWHRLIDGQSVERADEGLERRPESDWVVCENAWEAIIDAETFAKVQERRRASRDEYGHATGTAIRAEYLLTGSAFCGVCGAKLSGYTSTSGKAGRTKVKYYTCSAHQRGEREACPKRYTVPACLVEEHILGLIRHDLEQLRDDNRLGEFIAAEHRRIHGGQSDAREQLQRRLADLDQQTAKLRDHLRAVDSQTAQALGLYNEARELAQQKQEAEAQMKSAGMPGPEMPNVAELRATAAKLLARFDDLFAVGTIEEKREMIRLFVESIKADPDRNVVRISLYSPLALSRKIGVTGFEPAASTSRT